MHTLLLLGVTLFSCLDEGQDKSSAPEVVTASQDKPPGAAPPPPPPEDSLFKTLVKQFTLGGQIRVRAEYRDPTSYSNNAVFQGHKSDDVFLTRIRLNMKFSVTDDIDVFVQPQDQRAWGQEANIL